MTPGIYTAFAKHALLERLVRLGATDIPKTPRLFMKQRGPAELSTLQDSVSAVGQRVAKPIMGALEPALKRLPGRIQPAARRGAHMLASDPVGTAVSSAIPIPGAQAAYFGGKKALERGIDRAFPLPSK